VVEDNHLNHKINRFNRDIFRIYKVQRFIFVELFLIIFGSVLTPLLEIPYQPQAPIDNFNDALWWSIITVTSVGYGDMYPLSAGGRVIGSLLAISGVVVFGVAISILSIYFTQKKEEYSLKKNLSTLERLEKKTDELQSKVEYLVKK
jgi:voltage-gated potassium channel